MSGSSTDLSLEEKPCLSKRVHEKLVCNLRGSGDCPHSPETDDTTPYRLFNGDPAVDGLPTYMTGSRNTNHARIELSFRDTDDKTKGGAGSEIDIEGKLVVPITNGISHWDNLSLNTQTEWRNKAFGIQRRLGKMLDTHHDELTGVLGDRIKRIGVTPAPSWHDPEVRKKYLSGLSQSLNYILSKSLASSDAGPVRLSFRYPDAPNKWEMAETTTQRGGEIDRISAAKAAGFPGRPKDSLVESCTLLGRRHW